MFTVAPLVHIGTVRFSPALQAAFWILSGAYILDVAVRLNTAVVTEKNGVDMRRESVMRAWLHGGWAVFDALSAFPWDCIVELAFGHRATKWCIMLRVLRILYTRPLFRLSDPGVIDPDYVRFYFNLVPLMRFVFVFFIVLHTLTCAKLYLADDDPANCPNPENCDNQNDHRYDYAMFWVWNLMTTSPAPLTLNGYKQYMLCFLLMWTGVVFQGVVLRLASSLRQAFREPGEKVITVGDIGQEMFFILHGFCDIQIEMRKKLGAAGDKQQKDERLKQQQQTAMPELPDIANIQSMSSDDKIATLCTQSQAVLRVVMSQQKILQNAPAERARLQSSLDDLGKEVAVGAVARRCDQLADDQLSGFAALEKEIWQTQDIAAEVLSQTAPRREQTGPGREASSPGSPLHPLPESRGGRRRSSKVGNFVAFANFL
eukprot:gene54104-28085_t